jgi:hemolysin III
VLAGLGIAGKIFLPPISQKIWVPIYLGLAWIGAIAAVPLANMTSGVVLWLLAMGGVLYTLGVLFYANRRLQFAKAIWHGHVVAAAASHWVAVLVALFVVRS